MEPEYCYNDAIQQIKSMEGIGLIEPEDAAIAAIVTQYF